MKTTLFFAGLFGLAVSITAAEKKIVFVAGTPSHGPGEHEHRAGCLLLAKCLQQNPGFTTVVVTNGWPKDESVFNGADAIIVYADGGGGHPFVKAEHLKLIGALADKGVGIGAIHYGVEVPKDKGGPEFLDWIGGYFETFWSVNPTWTANYTNLPSHPVTRGVQPFSTRDEWYYHMRFRDGMKGVTPILTAVPPDSTRGRPGMNDAHGGNPEVQKHKGEPEHTMWVAERANGGRGFGVTGAHYHKNWGNENFRKVVLNAIAWIAKADVPEKGIQSTITPEDLAANLDPKGQRPRVAAPATNAPPRVEPFVSPVLPRK
jgi:type 1 glutamine amidotransferase